MGIYKEVKNIYPNGKMSVNFLKIKLEKEEKGLKIIRSSFTEDYICCNMNDFTIYTSLNTIDNIIEGREDDLFSIFFIKNSILKANSNFIFKYATDNLHLNYNFDYKIDINKSKEFIELLSRKNHKYPMPETLLSSLINNEVDIDVIKNVVVNFLSTNSLSELDFQKKSLQTLILNEINLLPNISRCGVEILNFSFNIAVDYSTIRMLDYKEGLDDSSKYKTLCIKCGRNSFISNVQQCVCGNWLTENKEEKSVIEKNLSLLYSTYSNIFIKYEESIEAFENLKDSSIDIEIYDELLYRKDSLEQKLLDCNEKYAKLRVCSKNENKSLKDEINLLNVQKEHINQQLRNNFSDLSKLKSENDLLKDKLNQASIKIDNELSKLNHKTLVDKFKCILEVDPIGRYAAAFIRINIEKQLFDFYKINFDQFRVKKYVNKKKKYIVDYNMIFKRCCELNNMNYTDSTIEKICNYRTITNSYIHNNDDNDKKIAKLIAKEFNEYSNDYNYKSILKRYSKKYLERAFDLFVKFKMIWDK